MNYDDTLNPPDNEPTREEIQKYQPVGPFKFDRWKTDRSGRLYAWGHDRAGVPVTAVIDNPNAIIETLEHYILPF